MELLAEFVEGEKLSALLKTISAEIVNNMDKENFDKYLNLRDELEEVIDEDIPEGIVISTLVDLSILRALEYIEDLTVFERKRVHEILAEELHE